MTDELKKLGRSAGKKPCPHVAECQRQVDADEYLDLCLTDHERCRSFQLWRLEAQLALPREWYQRKTAEEAERLAAGAEAALRGGQGRGWCQRSARKSGGAQPSSNNENTP